MAGLVLIFINGDTTLRTKTDSGGYYSIQLPAGTWSVGTVDFARIIDGPQKLVVSAGDNIVANYVIDTGIRAAA